MTEPTSPTDFEAAAAVAAALKDLSKPRQELVLRWVAESLGITGPQSLPAPPAPTPPVVTPPPAPHHAPMPPAPAHAVDIASFVASKQPKSDIQFVTVVAYYHRFVAPEGQRLSHITIDLAQNATRLSDWDRLTNPGSTLNNAKNQGYLDSAGHGKFSINTVGENLVARTLPGSGDSPKRTSTKNGGKKKGAVKKAAGKRKSAKGK